MLHRSSPTTAAKRSRGRPKYDDILTPREWQVLSLLEEGLTNREIADRLGISSDGAKYHVAEIISKLGVNNRREAVDFMHERELTAAHLAVPGWLAFLGFGKPRSMMKMAAGGLVVIALLAAGGFGLLKLATGASGGSDVGAQPAPGNEDLSAAVADFNGQPGQQGAATLNDPIAYCQAVGTIDRPDSRYTGSAQPDWLVQSLADAAGIPADSTFRTDPPTIAWRCANGQVLACTYGANIPCDSKANTDAQPTQAMSDWCADPPSPDAASFIPAFVIGHDSIYDWGCKDGAPVILKQLSQVDAQGYISKYWYHVLP